MYLKSYIDDLVARGRHSFCTKDLSKELGVSDGAMWAALSRLKRKGEIVSPAKGYYIIVPPEYRSLGTLPPEHFIPRLMDYWQTPYYVGLLSAAQRYGAAHQQPQICQVVLPKYHRPLKVGRIEVAFVSNKRFAEIPTREFNTPRGFILYSSPEATALDLVTYSAQCGGMGNVLTVLNELVEQMDVNLFKQLLAQTKEHPVLQRLGYLLDHIGEDELAKAVSDRLGSLYLAIVPLDRGNPNRTGEVSEKWRLCINTNLESDL